jgi:hypothetical protein
VDSERAETRLRFMAEAELRRAQALPRDPKPDPRDPGSGLACLARLRYVASALTAVGALDNEVAEAVLDDLNMALIVRQRLGERGQSGPPGGPASRLLAARVASRRPTSKSSILHGGQPGPAGSLRVVPVGRRLIISDENVTADVCLTSVVIRDDRALLSITGRASDWPRQPPFYLPFDQLRADDELGHSYQVLFTGGFGAGRADGWLTVRPGLPPGLRWLELHSGPGTDRVRVDLTAPPTPADVHTEQAGPASPGERLLDRLAGGMLGSLPAGGGRQAGLDEAVAALEDLGLLPPGSPATSRLAELSRQAGFRVVPGLVDALVAGDIPAAELPEAWTSVAAYFRRRNQPAGKRGVAPLAVPLPECDGVRFALTGLSSQPDRATLTAVVAGLGYDHLHRPDCLCWTRWFPWWIRDNTGQWHVAAFEEYSRFEGESATLGLRVVPPLAQPVTGLDVIITGPTRRIRARVPVAWVDADD